MSYAGKDADVADPWYSGDFERTYRDVLEGCKGILRVLRTVRREQGCGLQQYSFIT